LTKIKAENTRIPGLEDKIKAMSDASLLLNREKQDLCSLVSSLRDQLNEAEDDKTNAKRDENLMREKLKYVVKEKELIAQKLKNLEGVYQSELGEVKHIEELMKDLKNANMELEYSRKQDAQVKKEKEELKVIIKGLKSHIDDIEGQRDHFENQHDRVHQNLLQIQEEHQNAIQSAKNSIHHSDSMISTVESLKEEVEYLKSQLQSVQNEKVNLEQENQEMQQRLDDNIEEMIKMQSKENPRKSVQSRIMEDDEILWRRLEGILSIKYGLEIPSGPT
jgi:chromosome segregation ATPase